MSKVVFLSSYDPTDIKSWSGTPYSIHRILSENGHMVYNVGPVKSYSKHIIRLISYLLSKVTRYRLDASHSLVSSFELGVRASFLLRKIDCDYVVAPAGSAVLAFLFTKKNIIYISDTTFGQFCEYYDSSSRELPWFAKVIGDYIEKRALDKSTISTFPSSWAADFAKKHYLIENKIHQINWGPNLPYVERFNKSLPKFHKGETFNILFCGVEWLRKGGDIVLQTVESLINSGYKVQLHICGCSALLYDDAVKPTWLIEHGRLDKNNHVENQLLQSLFKAAHIMFVPSRAECYGMVFCEAAAYSLPVVSTKTGGITSIVDDGLTGYLLAPDSPITEYFMCIEKLITDEYSYLEMSNNARMTYESRLNWPTWFNEMTLIFERTVES
ncbi:glycosyltransferase family 4 protein [Aeromonas sp. FDAARGOS 1402]|uniref:glycosyltransferase family 4 protein n=1 Tax=Aeromonas sp. FDAARGOS 1402 TaxID=2778051 RepID=UPI001C24D4FD|nr:glycosyltransferase family 4 protein [Aeromonas sp. FDAARGOS 1402]QWZ54145.1 glycosyltransferase family 4 protein [Aeromonas sp. FDAARGOS 1402]